MKQLYFLLLSLFFSTAVFSQQKFEFGYSAKAGSFTWPGKESVEYSSAKDIYGPGVSLSFGAFVSKRLGGRLGVSAEMLYNFSGYKTRRRFVYPYSNGRFHQSNTIKRFKVRAFMLPMQMHFLLKKNGKVSLAAGVTPNFVIASKVSTSVEDNFGYSYSDKKNDLVKNKDGSQNFQFFFNAGAYYRLNDFTSLGLEFTGMLRPRDNIDFSFEGGGCLVGTENYEEKYPFGMQSLAISLRHNILR